MITKQLVEGLIDRTCTSKKWELCEYHADGGGVHIESCLCELIPNHVYIGDVLEKMQKKEFKSYCGLCDADADFITLLNLWGACSFSRSLQEIILESEWSHSAHAKVCNVGHEEVLTSPEANALFSFLQEIL